MEIYKTPFKNEVDVYQDGTVPFYRDVDGSLWAITGHSHMGDICMFKGTNLLDMQKMYAIKTEFLVGHADYAFNGIRYPEGIRARGSVWPFGLYICPKTHRFFCFFHNETGWNGKGSGYDERGYCDTPFYDTDFRHIGLMHSDDEGKNWSFDRWVVTSEAPCFSSKFVPDPTLGIGQKDKPLITGSGDFSMYVEDGYIYLLYNIIYTDSESQYWESCHTYIARTRIREDGFMGDFVKYYDGKFQEAGNMGKETPICLNAWHARVIYSNLDKCYYMAYNPVLPKVSPYPLAEYLIIQRSTNLFDWSQAEKVNACEEKIGGHYFTIIPKNAVNNPFVNETDEFSILISGSALDVKGFDLKISK